MSNKAYDQVTEKKLYERGQKVEFHCFFLEQTIASLISKIVSHRRFYDR